MVWTWQEVISYARKAVEQDVIDSGPPKVRSISVRSTIEKKVSCMGCQNSWNLVSSHLGLITTLSDWYTKPYINFLYFVQNVFSILSSNKTKREKLKNTSSSIFLVNDSFLVFTNSFIYWLFCLFFTWTTNQQICYRNSVDSLRYSHWLQLSSLS